MWASLVAQLVKNLPAMHKTWVQSLVWEDSPGVGYSCLENPHGQRSLVGYSPWDCKESDTTEQITLGIRVSACSISFIAPQLRQGCPVVNLEGEREL